MLSRRDKSANAERAAEIRRQNREKYQDRIDKVAEHTVLFGAPDRAPSRHMGTGSDVVLTSNDTVTEMIHQRAMYPQEKLSLLNFADYYRAGGLFLKGSAAQEEALCHESILYNVLTSPQLTGYYDWNNDHKNGGLYTDRALYSEEVMFYRNGEEYLCDVITCAAPNFYRGKRYRSIPPEDNSRALSKRIAFVRDVAEDRGVQVLILGAYGCGVFSQDPYEVACLFKEAFQDSSVKLTVYAVPGNNKNSRAFGEVFG